MVDFGKLAAQAAAPAAASLLTHNTRSSALSAAAAAAGAGRPHVIQVHFTGAVQPVPAQQHANGPSTQLVQEMSQLLPPVGGAGGGVGVAASAVAVDAAAVDAAEAGLRDQAGGVPAAGATTGNSAGAVGGQGKGKGGGMRAYRQRVQQWKAAVGARMKRGLKGGRGKGVDGAGGTGVIMSGSSGGPNEHMMGFAGGFERRECVLGALAADSTSSRRRLWCKLPARTGYLNNNTRLPCLICSVATLPLFLLARSYHNCNCESHPGPCRQWPPSAQLREAAC